MTARTGLMVYIAVYIFTLFAVSFIVARYTDESVTDPDKFLVLVIASLRWPLILPLAGAGLLLFGMVYLVDKLTGK